MNTVFRIIRKNLKLLIRSKSSALIVILGPLLVIFLVGMAFDNSESYSVKIGAYSESYSEISDGIITELDDYDFRVTKYDSEQQCQEAIKQGAIHTCIVFSPDFDIGEGKSNEITFHIDYSKINLVWMILESLSERIKSKSSEISVDLTNVLIHKIEQTKEEIQSDKTRVLGMIEQNNKETGSVTSISTRLKGLNLGMSMEDFPINSIVNKTLIIQDAAGWAAKYGLELITPVRNDIVNFNISDEEKQPILDLMDRTRLKLENIDEKMFRESGELETLVQGMELDIKTVKARLDTATEARTEVMTKIDNLLNFLENDLAVLMELQASFNSIETNMANIEISDAEDIVSPIVTKIMPLSAEKTHLNYIFPSLIILVIMFISLLLSSTLVMMEKGSKAYFRNFITPTKDIVFVIATYLTSLILLLVQLMIILAVAVYFFGSQLTVVLGTVIGVLILIGTIFILIGMLIGYLFNSEETATLASISTGTVMLFVSNLILPIESMPEYILKFAKFNPFLIAESILRKITIFHYSLYDTMFEFRILIIYAVVLLVSLVIVQKFMKRHFIFKYAKRLKPKKK